MLTPQDLQEISFEKAKIGGYVMKSVDDVLEPLLQDYVTLYKENAVLKSKMRLLVERLENYRANESEMKAALEKARSQKAAPAEAAPAAPATAAPGAADAEAERLRQAKQATADFVRAVEAQLARQQEALEALKRELPVEQAAPRTPKAEELPSRRYDSPADIAAQIEKNVSRITGDTPRTKTEPRLPNKTDAAKAMPVLDERTTAKFSNLKFGKNYRPE